jgi:hypothetical protein
MLDLSSQSSVNAWHSTHPSVYSFMSRAWNFSQQSAPAAYTGPIGVANRGLIFAFDIRHPNRLMVTIFRELVKDGVDPHSKNRRGTGDRKNSLRDEQSTLESYTVLKTKRSALRDKQPTLKSSMWR